ncbi:MAG: ribonuclease P protein component 1 [Methanobrevibacter sp.]|jgi:ribonuclease P protein subunit POP4|nr:ribonuclease P protein component 1 [Methanobrevibacter sp.]
MITSNNVFYHELIGLYVKVVKSSNESLIGISGNIIDETKKTISIETKIESADKKNKDKNKINKISEIKMIPKDVSIFHLFLPNNELVEIDGKILLNRPEDRIKKRYKKL